MLSPFHVELHGTCGTCGGQGSTRLAHAVQLGGGLVALEFYAWSGCGHIVPAALLTDDKNAHPVIQPATPPKAGLVPICYACGKQPCNCQRPSKTGNPSPISASPVQRAPTSPLATSSPAPRAAPPVDDGGLDDFDLLPDAE